MAIILIATVTPGRNRKTRPGFLKKTVCGIVVQNKPSSSFSGLSNMFKMERSLVKHSLKLRLP